MTLIDVRDFDVDDGEVKVEKRPFVKRRRPHDVAEVDDEVPLKVSMEMRPVVNAIVTYGRKMNALGGLEAATMLDDIAKNLRKLCLDKNHALKCLIADIEKNAERIRVEFDTAYSEIEKI